MQGGRAIGQSDPIGGVPVDRPTDPPEIVGSIYRGLGINRDTILPGPSGRPFPVIDFNRHEIKELF